MTEAGQPQPCAELPEGFTRHAGGNEWRPPAALKPSDWIQPIYRGPEDPAKGIRRHFGFAGYFDWSHDGGDDDIIAWRKEARP